MSSEEVKQEIIHYIQSLETSYTDAIRDLQLVIDREKRSKKKVVSEHINLSADRTELENLFMSCIEDVRKDIMRRRLKIEVQAGKRYSHLD